MTPGKWRLLRACLGISQERMGMLLFQSQDAISLIESGKLEPHPRTVQLLRYLLEDPRIRRWLEEAGFPHPWPGEGEPDLVTQVFSSRSGHCARCGIVLSSDHMSTPSSSRLCDRCRQEDQEERRN